MKKKTLSVGGCSFFFNFFLLKSASSYWSNVWAANMASAMGEKGKMCGVLTDRFLPLFGQKNCAFRGEIFVTEDNKPSQAAKKIIKIPLKL